MPDDPTQLHDSTDTCDTLSSMYVPIVFVPGVMGSRIDMPSAQLTWDPDTLSKMAQWATFQLNGRSSRQWNRAALSPSWSQANVLTSLSDTARNHVVAELAALYGDQNATNPSPDPIEVYYGRTRGWAGCAWGFYGPILLHLESIFNRSGNHPVYGFGYDWRDSNSNSGAKLNALISRLLSESNGVAQDVVIVTHSMGGLVVRGALVNDPTLDAKIRGVVHTVQPSNGAVACYRRFFTGAVGSLDGSGSRERFLNNVMGGTPGEYAYCLSGAPGPLQLLPNHIYQPDEPWLEYPTGQLDLTNVYDIYALYGWPGLQGAVNSGQTECGSADDIANQRAVNDLLTNLASAAEFHTNAATMAHRNTLALYSLGLTTDDHVRFLNPYPPTATWVAPQWGDLPQDMDLLHCGSGDGTVPKVSAQCPALSLAMPAEPFLPKALGHSDVFQNDAFRTRTAELVAMLLRVSPGGLFSDAQCP